ncbi:magnesium transporter [Xylella fastidiosa subsp. multiplex]|uniref:Magnesium transporter n=1 Tax=Xylella fastidiosa subsp. multiplex TaxID=644357 RepID=A0A9Q4ML93_XYLFS|nr:magnesium transporter [Xylella fastidiosa subsp. multiplex]MBE0275249.1 magnesium transporter [Xylella fastidiosa subsp. multiplex]MBE0277422.1 magnesium transporter [Xylella fastidiosa subsp. multiplex]MBE0281735.1 magnesium transporter [Xylella fastidiosa subsp. multiplex]MBS9445027.1 magnesium transporter [Xylella fastidiosa subsp. multiplex]
MAQTTPAVPGDLLSTDDQLMYRSIGRRVIIPMTLKRLGFHPALAGGVILTTLTNTNVTGFLGLATLILLR